jgi:Glycosyltransferase family 87
VTQLSRILRRWLWGIAGVYAGFVLIATTVWPLRGHRDITDYNFFDPLVAARIFSSGSQCIYCNKAQEAAASAWIHHQVVQSAPQYLDPPPVAFALQPIAALAPDVAITIMFFAMFICLGIAVWLMYSKFLSQRLPGWQCLIVLGSIVLISSSDDMWVGQWSPMLLLPAVLAVIRAREGKKTSAGLLLSIIFLKIQLVYLVAAILLGCREWRVLRGMAIGGFLWASASVLVLGIPHFGDWAALIGGSLRDDPSLSWGIPGTVAAITSSPAIADWSGLVLSLFVFGGALRWGERLKQKTDIAIGLGILASVACSPHFFSYDLVFTALPFCLLSEARPGTAIALAVSERLLLVACLFVGSLAPSHLTPLVIAAVAIGLLWTNRETQSVSAPRLRAALPPQSSA